MEDEKKQVQVSEPSTEEKIAAIAAKNKKLLKKFEEKAITTKEELLDYSIQMLARVLQKLDKDIISIDPDNIITIKTNNGLNKFNPTGLSKEERMHLVEMQDRLVKQINVLLVDNKDLPEEKALSAQNLIELTKALYRGVPKPETREVIEINKEKGDEKEKS